MEGSPSGLWRTLGKRVEAQVSRGFESLSLRQYKRVCPGRLFYIAERSAFGSSRLAASVDNNSRARSASPPAEIHFEDGSSRAVILILCLSTVSVFAESIVCCYRDVMIQPDRPNACLYQDIDGALAFVADGENPPFKTVKLYRDVVCAPEVVLRLGETGLDVIIVSTRPEFDSTSLLKQMRAPFGDKVLELIVVETNPNEIRSRRIHEKVEAIKQDQASVRRPFAWVDDELSPAVRAEIDATHGNTPHILVQTDSQTGYSRADLAIVEDFARTYVI